MISKQLLSNHIVKNNKTVLHNFSYLTVLQIFTILFPLITYPYLLRTLGFELYGIVIFAQAIVANIDIVINYGFNLNGARDIACNKSNRSKISIIVSSIYILKFGLWLICFLLYLAVVFTFDFFEHFRLLYVATYFISLNTVFVPIWFFQGIEKMKYLTFINVGVRLFFISLIFVVVKKQSDYFLVPLLNAIGAILGGLAAFYIVLNREKIRFVWPGTVLLKYYFKDSTPLFFTSLSTNIYVNLNKMVVGADLGMSEVTVYDMAEKITTVLKIPISMLSQATFPKISREKSIAYINKVMRVSVGTIFVLYLVICVSAHWIVWFLSGSYMLLADTTIRIMTLSALFCSANVFLGANRLMAFGYKRQYMLANLYASALFLFVLFVLCISDYINLMSLAVLAVWGELAVFGFYFVQNRKLKLI